jgi:hypothetical protein
MFSFFSTYFLILVIPVFFLLIGLNLPNKINLCETIIISESPKELFKHFADFKIFTKWCPWFKKIPKSNIIFYGENMTAGSKVAFQISSKSFEKSFELNHLEINQKIIFDVDFGFTQKGKMEIEFNEIEKEKTYIYWNFYLPLGNNPIERWYGLYVGHIYRKKLKNGLLTLKLKTENL